MVHTSEIWEELLIGGKFASSNQEHYLDLGSDTSSVWNFCTHFSDVIPQGSTTGCIVKCLVFSQAKDDTVI